MGVDTEPQKKARIAGEICPINVVYPSGIANPANNCYALLQCCRKHQGKWVNLNSQFIGYGDWKGCTGSACRHQAAVAKKYNINTITIPPFHSKEARRMFAVLARGEDNVMGIDFYADLCDTSKHDWGLNSATDHTKVHLSSSDSDTVHLSPSDSDSDSVHLRSSCILGTSVMPRSSSSTICTCTSCSGSPHNATHLSSYESSTNLMTLS